jgi:hypothetical protein
MIPAGGDGASEAQTRARSYIAALLESLRELHRRTEVDDPAISQMAVRSRLAHLAGALEALARVGVIDDDERERILDEARTAEDTAGPATTWAPSDPIDTRLLRVLPVAEPMSDFEGASLAVLAVEDRLGGIVVTWTLHWPPGDEERRQPRSFALSDDVGTAYTLHRHVATAGFATVRGVVSFSPRPPRPAATLVVDLGGRRFTLPSH